MEEITMTFEARLLMEPYIIENYSKYIDMDKAMMSAIKASENIIKNKKPKKDVWL